MLIEDVRLTCSSGAIRKISLSFTTRWSRGQALVKLIEGTLSCAGEDITPPYQFPYQILTFDSERALYPSVVIEISDPAIRFIEARRNGGDARFTTEIKYRQFELKQQPPSTADYIDLFASGGYNSTKYDLTIPRSDWLRNLRSLGWSETELFEINTKPLQQDPHLTAALSKIHEATTYFREGEYDLTLSACKQALDALESVKIAGTQAPGLEAVLARCFRDESKRDHVKSTIEATRQMCGLGAKETYPALAFSRSETEYCLSTTLSIFSLLSRRMTEGAGLRVSN